LPFSKVLITTGSVLRLSGARVSGAAARAARPENVSDIEVLSRSEAVALFVERAKAAKPGFRLVEQNASVIAQVCARLDGLPWR
jgi:predicted ATPase